MGFTLCPGPWLSDPWKCCLRKTTPERPNQTRQKKGNKNLSFYPCGLSHCLRTHGKTRDIPYHHSLLCLTSSYMTCEFFMVNSSSLPLEIVSLNLQPCYRAAGTPFPSSTYKDPIFLDLHAEELFPRKTPTLGCALARHALQSYPKGNIAPSTTIKTNQAPTAQWTHSQDETKQGLSSPEPGLTLHLPNIRAAPDGCTGTVALHNTIFPLLLLALERTQYQHLLSLLPPTHEESRDP